MPSNQEPRTLAQIGGLSPLPSAPEASVLLMIDPQREYTAGLLRLQNIEAAVEEGARLRDLPHPFGTGVTPAEIIQAGTLAALSDRFSVVIQDTVALSSATKLRR